MSLLFKRQQNIEENNKYLESLGFLSSAFLGTGPAIPSAKKTETSSTPRSSTQEFSLSHFKSNFYPSRITQASDLYSHLSSDTSLTHFPAVVTGVPGCGKSSITKEILSQLALPSFGSNHPRMLIHIRCRVYKDTKSFIVGVWSIVGEAYNEYISTRRAEGRSVPTSLTASFFDKSPVPKNFGELCAGLRKFLSEVSQKLDDGKIASSYNTVHGNANKTNSSSTFHPSTSSSSSSSSGKVNKNGVNATTGTDRSFGSSSGDSSSVPDDNNNNDSSGRSRRRLGGSAGMRPVYMQFDHVDSLDMLELGLAQLVLELPKVQ